MEAAEKGEIPLEKYERCLLGVYIMGADIGAGANKDVSKDDGHSRSE
jgi:hypothetical protein